MRPGHNWAAKPSESPITRHLWSSLKNQSCSMPTMQRRPQCQAVYPRQVTALLMDAASSLPFPVSGSQPLSLLSHTPKALVTSEGEIHFKTHLQPWTPPGFDSKREHCHFELPGMFHQSQSGAEAWWLRCQSWEGVPTPSLTSFGAWAGSFTLSKPELPQLQNQDNNDNTQNTHRQNCCIH